MKNFLEYVRQRLEVNEYKFSKQFANLDLFMQSPDDKLIWICYLDKEIEPEQIRRMFDFTGHVLVVVNEKLIPNEITSREETPQWLRVLHGLWMGRIYVWNDRHLFGIHFDYDSGDISESGAIQPDELLLVETGTWLRGWTGTYRLARFWDKSWWQESAWTFHETYNRYKQEQEKVNSQQWQDYQKASDSSSRQAYEQARDEYQRQQQQRENRQERAYYAPPKQQGSKRDFMREFMTCGNLSAARKLYLQLVKDNHPDVHGQEKTAIMQDINAAWDKAQEVLI